MIPLSKLEVRKCHQRKGGAGENRHPIKLDHLLRLNHEISRLMGTEPKSVLVVPFQGEKMVDRATLAFLPNL